MNSLEISAVGTDVFRDLEVGPEMVVIPAGEFLMGSVKREHGHSPAEAPQHHVRFTKPFAVGRFAVTFDQWDAAVEYGGCDGYLPSDQGWGRHGYPVINVSWEDARAYVAWLRQQTGRQYRLLSEAEWEYAARAGTDTPFWWGASISDEQAQYDGRHSYGGGPRGETQRSTVPVSCFEPNPWGLYNMHGNVWEWVEDIYHCNHEGAPRNGSARLDEPFNLGSRTLKGGSWLDRPKRLRAADRQVSEPDDRAYCYGFRVALTL